MTKHVSSLFLLSMLAIVAGGLRAQPIPGRYIVEFDSDPSIVSVAASPRVRLADSAPQMAARRAQIQAEHAVQAAAIGGIGGTVLRRYDTVLNGMTVQIADQNVAQLRALPGVRAVYPDKLWHTVLDQAVKVHRISDTWTTLAGGASSAGAGVLIGMLDTGIDPSHPGFQSFSTPVPAGFPIVSSSAEIANTNNKIIVSRDYTGSGGMDLVGHGTGTAMIAAGLTSTPSVDCAHVAFCANSFDFQQNPVTGAASGAWLGNYKVCDNSGGCSTSNFLSALSDVVNDAAALQSATGSQDIRVVVNYSAGGPSLFASDENGAEARAIRNAVAAGILVVVAAGNDGTDHNGSQASSTISDPGVVPDAIAVGAVVNERIFDYSVSVPGTAPFEAAIPDTTNDTNSPDLSDPMQAPMVDVTQIDGNGLACGTLPAGSLSGKIALVQRGTCSFNSKLDNAALAGAVAAVIYNNAGDDRLNMTLSDASLPALFVGQQDGQTLQGLIGSNTSANVLLDFAGLTPFPLGTSDIVSTYSAAGPTASGKSKPDVLAVGGDYIVLDSAGLDVWNAQVISADSTANDAANPYIVGSGTSFSAPFVSAGIAILKAARPGLTAPQYRSLAVNSAPQFTSFIDGSLGKPAVVGSGKLDLLGAMQNNLTAVPSVLNFQTGAGTVNNTQQIVVTNIGTSQDTFSVTVNSIDGAIKPVVDKSTFSVGPGASQTITVTLSGSGLTAGAYDGYLSITGTQTQVATRIGYWFGIPGSAVQNISVLNQNQLNGGGSPLEGDLYIYVRYTDQAGLPIAGDPPSVSALAPRSKVLRIVPIGDIPGTYEVDIQLGRTSNTYDEFDIAAGSAMTPVYIPVY
ncbi:MAG: S8 family serine peptidase [Bryobacterales bacterium]|nr:S8 family serine peptidase [Bryobacterales bacterium]MBV9396584.1 S8 family serine peptidase [Bryobacterales bacterium]